MKKLLSLIEGDVISTPKVRILVFAVFLTILIVLPAFVHNQWVTGPMVNATLLLATVLAGPMEAVILGLMPSAAALSAGLLPLPLAPMVPFIMMGNAVLIAAFYYLQKRHYVLRLGLSALFKFAFLHFAVVFVMSDLLEQGVVSKLLVMMSWPQFFTAVIGGIIIYPILKTIKK